MVTASFGFAFPQGTSDYEISISIFPGSGYIQWGHNDITQTNPAVTTYSHTYANAGEHAVTLYDVELYGILKAPTLSSFAIMKNVHSGVLGGNPVILTNNLILCEGIQMIYYGAFFGQTSLTTLSFPTSLTYIGQNAFEEMDSLTTVTFTSDTPPTFDSFPGQDNTPFKECPNLTTIYVPDGSIDAYKTAIPSRASIIQGIGYTEVPYIEINNHTYKMRDDISRQYATYFTAQFEETSKVLSKTHASLTQAQYDTLTELQKNDGTEYFITDAVAEGDFSNLESRLLKMESNFIDVSPNVTIVDPARYKSMTKVDANTVEIIVNDPVTTKDYKITVTASGSGNTRTNPQYTIEEVI